MKNFLGSITLRYASRLGQAKAGQTFSRVGSHASSARYYSKPPGNQGESSERIKKLTHAFNRSQEQVQNITERQVRMELDLSKIAVNMSDQLQKITMRISKKDKTIADLSENIEKLATKLQDQARQISDLEIKICLNLPASYLKEVGSKSPSKSSSSPSPSN